MFEIRHLSYRIKSRPNPDYSEDMTGTEQIEWVLVNLVFTPDDPKLFLHLAEEYKKELVITDLEKWEETIHNSNWLEESLEKEPDENGFITIDVPDTSEFTQEGWVAQDSHLKYIEKFKVFNLQGYYAWSPTVQGILSEIRLLQNGINMQRTTRDYVLYRAINALQWFWD